MPSYADDYEMKIFHGNEPESNLKTNQVFDISSTSTLIFIYYGLLGVYACDPPLVFVKVERTRFAQFHMSLLL